MSRAREIDAALRRGVSPITVARTFACGVRFAETRAVIVAEEQRMRADLRKQRSEQAREARLRSLEEENLPRSTERWLALDIRYENDPRSMPWRPGARVSRPDHLRTLGGVVEYGNREAA